MYTYIYAIYRYTYIISYNHSGKSYTYNLDFSHSMAQPWCPMLICSVSQQVSKCQDDGKVTDDYIILFVNIPGLLLGVSIAQIIPK